MVQNLIFEIYLFISDILAERLKANKKDHSFYNTAFLSKPYSLYEPQPTQHCRKCSPTTLPKTLITLQISQQTCFWLVSEKKHLQSTISRRARTAFSKHF